MKAPGKKAEELHTMFYRSFKLSNSEKDISWSDKHAKECVLFTCAIIIECADNHIYKEHNDFTVLSYWKAVKQEMEKS